MGAALSLAVAGGSFTYLELANRYRTATQHLGDAISQVSHLNAAVNDHEIQSHKLWQGSSIDRAAYLRGEQQISRLFSVGLRDLQGPGEHVLLLRASRVWRAELVKRGLWGAGAGARPGGVSASMQAAYGGAQDAVYATLGQLSLTAIANGRSELGSAKRFEQIGIALLAGVLALVLALMLYFAHRLTRDVVRPIVSLQTRVRQLGEGSFVAAGAPAASLHPNEVDDLAVSFDQMAGALAATHRELELRATSDSLTGLPNRSLFNTRLAQLFAAEDRPFRVLFVDIDDFKLVNDSVGHAAGDELLVAVAKRLSASARPQDFVARLGGDEFAIVVVGDAGAQIPANAVAQRVLDAFVAPVAVGPAHLDVSVSIGVSGGDSSAQDAPSAVAEADFAMYTAKRGGKGRYETFEAPEARPAASPGDSRTPHAHARARVGA